MQPELSGAALLSYADGGPDSGTPGPQLADAQNTQIRTASVLTEKQSMSPQIGGSVRVPRDERRSRDVVRDVRAPKSGRRIGAWVVGVTACNPKAPGLGNGSMSGEVK
jgi:hypothetical protein